MEVPPLVTYVVAWFGLGAGVFALFERGEDALDENVKSDISRWLQNLDPSGLVENWPSGFVRLFDSVFGKQHFTKRCFIRSCAASGLALLTMSSLIYALNPPAFTEAMRVLLVAPWNEDWLFGSAYVLQAAVVALVIGGNLLGDYVSLLKTRYLLQWMSKTRIKSLVALGLLADVVATIIIWTIGLLLGAGFVILVSDVEIDVASLPSQILDVMLSVSHPATWSEEPPALIMLSAAFFPSLWVWLYVSAGLVVKGAHAMGAGLELFRRVFDVKHKPLRSIGLVCNLAITAVFVAGLLF